MLQGGLIQALIRSAPSAVVAMDTDGRVTMLNDRAEALLNTTIDEALGQPYPSVFGESLSSRVLRLFMLAVRTEDSAAPRVIHPMLPGGRRAELRASMAPIRDGNGAMVGVLFVADEPLPEVDAAPGQREVAERLREALRRYLGDNVAALVEQRPSFINITAERRYVSVLHADIRGYTTRAEVMEPEDTAKLLLQHHGPAVDVLLREGATLDRFIGDSVLAIWNAPGSCEDHARAAIRGALAVREAAGRVGMGLGYGIGVHTGNAVVGNLGNEHYMNYTAIGDTVNVAARLQAEAGVGEVLCSERTLAEAGDGIESVSLGALHVKGRKEPVDAYRIEGIEPRGGA